MLAEYPKPRKPLRSHKARSVSPHPITSPSLLPVEIVPDYNRDGKIDGKDRGRVTDENSWHWWINDDNDKTVDKRGENLDDAHWQADDKKDCNDLRVDGMRDFIDFFPLHLDLKAALAVLPSSDYKYVLKHDEEALKFFEYSKARIDGRFSFLAVDLYLKDASKAEEIRDEELKLVSKDGVELTEDYLEQAKIGRGVILVEGTKQTWKPLTLQIIRKEDSTKMGEMNFPISIGPVEWMYRRVNMRALPIYPAVVYGPTDAGEPSAYPDELTNGKYVAYVHGYNISEKKARGSQSNIFKRLHQLGNKARFIGVFWHGDPDNPSGTKLPAPDYHRAVYNGLYTGQLLKTHLSFTQNSELTILAHSLGNVVVSNAIANHGLKVNQYYMINCAMPIEAYDASQTSSNNNLGEANEDVDMQRNMTEDDWKKYYDYDDGAEKGKQQRLFAANWYDLFDETDNRRKLTWKDLFNPPPPDSEPDNQLKLLSVAYNFYSPTDHVVENADDSEEFGDWDNIWSSATDAGRHAWVSQEIGKGGQNLLAKPSFHDNNGGWRFSDNYLSLHLLPFPHSGPFTPERASQQISDEQLKTKPFHLEFLHAGLYDPARGSGTAGETLKRLELLATGIPAMSYAVAVNPLDVFEVTELNPVLKNFNMAASLKSDGVWPTHKYQNNREDWLHGDFKDVAFQYLHPMYQKMIDLGKLNENKN
jgi:hypothetical protein